MLKGFIDDIKAEITILEGQPPTAQLSRLYGDLETALMIEAEAKQRKKTAIPVLSYHER